MNQEQLDKYFSSIWRSNLSQYKYSGLQLVEKIKPYETVLDVGCGFNEFKQHIPNLIGIDPANDNADVKTMIEYYDPPHKFDVAFCLGSINFGDYFKVVSQIAYVVRCLKPQARIYWRCNPGSYDHGNEECHQIDFFPWSIDKHVHFAEIFKFRIDKICWDNNNRIYAEWSR